MQDSLGAPTSVEGCWLVTYTNCGGGRSTWVFQDRRQADKGWRDIVTAFRSLLVPDAGGRLTMVGPK